MAVGSRAGAVLRRRGLSVSPRFLWECLTSRTVSPFPARPWPHRSPLADHPVPVGIPHVGVRGMAAAHWRDPVAPCFSAGDAPVAVVVVLTERAAAACRRCWLLVRSAALGLTATGLADNPVPITIAHIGVGWMVRRTGAIMRAGIGARDRAVVVGPLNASHAHRRPSR